MPLLTWAKPPVGRLAGQPITKLAVLFVPAEEREIDHPKHVPTRAVDEVPRASEMEADLRQRSPRGLFVRGHGNLEVLGRPTVGDIARFGEIVDQHTASVLAERSSSGRGARRGKT